MGAVPSNTPHAHLSRLPAARGLHFVPAAARRVRAETGRPSDRVEGEVEGVVQEDAVPMVPMDREL
jgi:hypothetical protein